MKYVFATSWAIVLMALIVLHSRVPALQIILDQRSIANKENERANK